MNHHKRLSKWRRPIKFWRAVFTQKRWDRFYPPRLSHFTRQRPVSLLSTSFLRRSLGKQLQVTLQVYHHNSVSVFIQFICSGDHPAVEQTYQSCTEDVNTVERWSSVEFNDLTGRFCTVAESYELVVCSVGLSELRESTHWAFDDAYFAFYHVCHICCSGVLGALGISHRSLHHTLSSVYLRPCAALASSVSLTSDTVYRLLLLCTFILKWCFIPLTAAAHFHFVPVKIKALRHTNRFSNRPLDKISLYESYNFNIYL